MADHPLRPAIHRRLGKPLPYQQANGPQAPPLAHKAFNPKINRGIIPSFPGLFHNQRAGYLRVTHPSATATEVTVRLACVKPAASVRSEPGSNSPIEKEIDLILNSKSHMKNQEIMR